MLQPLLKRTCSATFQVVKRVVLLQVSVLLRLHGALNVANLVAVYEDADNVHLVMELCRGGELLARARKAHYSERTVRLTSPRTREWADFLRS